MILFWISGGHNFYPDPPDSAPYKQIIDKQIDKIKDKLKKHPQKRAYFGLTRSLTSIVPKEETKNWNCIRYSYVQKAASYFSRDTQFRHSGKKLDKRNRLTFAEVEWEKTKKKISVLVRHKGTKEIAEHPLGLPRFFIARFPAVTKLDLNNSVIPTIDVKLSRQTTHAYQCSLCQYSNDNENQLKRHENDHVTCTVLFFVVIR